MSPVVIRMTSDAVEVDEMRKFLGEITPLVTSVVRDTNKTIMNLIQGRTPVGERGVDPHSGQMKKSWGFVEESQKSFSFETEVPYSLVLEEGLYPWAETARTLGGFSKQAPRGILRPLLEDGDLEKQIVDSILQMIERRLVA